MVLASFFSTPPNPISRYGLTPSMATVLWLLYRVVTYVMHNFRENERVKLLAQINADPKLKDIVLK